VEERRIFFGNVQQRANDDCDFVTAPSFPLGWYCPSRHQLDIAQMQAHRMFHAIELNTNGMLARSLTTGAPHNPSGFRRCPLDPVFAQPAQAYRITWLEHSGFCLSNL